MTVKLTKLGGILAAAGYLGSIIGFIILEPKLDIQTKVAFSGVAFLVAGIVCWMVGTVGDN